jgi:magnesium transporter
LPTEQSTDPQSPDARLRASERDVLRDALRDQSERGQTKSDIILLSVQRLLRRGAITNLSKMLGRMHPADAARVITHLSSPKEKREVFELVRGEAKRGQVLSELDGDSIQQVLADLLHSDIAWLLKDLGLTTSPIFWGFSRKSGAKTFSR